jgi:hypothetical protein
VAFEPLESLSRFDGEIIINTLPGGSGVTLPLRPGMTLVESAYAAADTASAPGVATISGIDLLHAQAMRQHELFMRVFDER